MLILLVHLVPLLFYPHNIWKEKYCSIQKEKKEKVFVQILPFHYENVIKIWTLNLLSNL